MRRHPKIRRIDQKIALQNLVNAATNTLNTFREWASEIDGHLSVEAIALEHLDDALIVIRKRYRLTGKDNPNNHENRME